jgi:hypothetical protein
MSLWLEGGQRGRHASDISVQVKRLVGVVAGLALGGCGGGGAGPSGTAGASGRTGAAGSDGSAGAIETAGSNGAAGSGGAAGAAGTGRAAVAVVNQVTIDANNLAPLLVQALGTPNTTVIVADGVELDLTPYLLQGPITIANGVQLIGGRIAEPGKRFQQGPRLFVTPDPNVSDPVNDPSFLSHWPDPLFLIGGDNVRISGVRLEGPGAPPDAWRAQVGRPQCPSSPCAQGYTRGIQFADKINIEIDHNEFSGWNTAAVEPSNDGANDRVWQMWTSKVTADSSGIHYPAGIEPVNIHDNYFHDNWYPTSPAPWSACSQANRDACMPYFGYGVVASGTHVLIERNVFNDYYHAIAANGCPGSGYRAYRNLVLNHGGGAEAFNAHYRRPECGVPSSAAGHDFDVRWNSFLYSDWAALYISGTPDVGAFVSSNVFTNDHVKEDAVRLGNGGDWGKVWLDGTNLEGVKSWFDASHFSTDCDFDGDGINDSFITTGESWWFQSRDHRKGEAPWVYLNTNTLLVENVRLGYFSPDAVRNHVCDVATKDGFYKGGTGAGFEFFDTLVHYYSGLDFGLPSSWEAISGDFNGDGNTDYARVGSTGAWLFLSQGDGTFSTGFQAYDALAFGAPSTNWPTIAGDFDHDGDTDYARVGATGAWVFLANPSSGNGGFNDPVFQDYTHNGLNFGDPATNWPTITGDFDHDGDTDYARVGATGAWVFLANPSSGNGGFNDPVFQDYGGLNFGDPATNWPTITGDFDHDGNTDYARVGATGAWVFLANPDSGNGGFNDPVFQDYTHNGLNFGDPATNWPTITGDFDHDGNTDYARVGATGAWVFLANPNSGNGGFNDPVFQDYDGLNFGDPATNWQTITGDFDGDGKTDYARLGDTGVWIFSGSSSGSFTTDFQSYEEGLMFGSPSAWQVVTGHFRRDGKTGYVLLGGDRAYTFVHR